MTLLSAEQRQAIQTGGFPLEVRDETSDQVFYLVSAEEYQRMREILDKTEEIDPSYFEFSDFTPAP
jgi:hypothetical protein